MTVTFEVAAVILVTGAVDVMIVGTVVTIIVIHVAVSAGVGINMSSHMLRAMTQ